MRPTGYGDTIMLKRLAIPLTLAAALALPAGIARADGPSPNSNCMATLSAATGQAGVRDDLAHFINALAGNAGVTPGAINSALAQTPSSC
jgi:hypothetical protein